VRNHKSLAKTQEVWCQSRNWLQIWYGTDSDSLSAWYPTCCRTAIANHNTQCFDNHSCHAMYHGTKTSMFPPPAAQPPPMTSPTSSSFPTWVNLDVIKQNICHSLCKDFKHHPPLDFTPVNNLHHTVCNHTAQLSNYAKTKQQLMQQPSGCLTPHSSICFTRNISWFPPCIDLAALKWCIHQLDDDIQILWDGIHTNLDNYAPTLDLLPDPNVFTPSCQSPEPSNNFHLDGIICCTNFAININNR